jgi:hypothetical protein
MNFSFKSVSIQFKIMIPFLTSVVDPDPVGSASFCQIRDQDRHPGQLIRIQIWSRIRILYSRKYQYESYNTYNIVKKDKTT